MIENLRLASAALKDPADGWLTTLAVVMVVTFMIYELVRWLRDGDK